MNSPRYPSAARWLVSRAGLGAWLLLAAVRLPAQFAYFDVDTDTIAVNGGTTVGTAITIEAVFILPGGAGGTLYFEQRDGLEHKQLAVSETAVGGFAFASFAASASVNTPVSLNTPHHLAFVQDSTDSSRRLFLDGVLVFQDLNGAGAIANAGAGPYPAAIGASTYELTNQFVPSFIGYLDSIRVSDIARYAATFTAPTGDLAADANTLLLYNFSPGDISGGTVADLSGHGLTGTFGTGFSGATAPQLAAAIPEPSAAAALLGALALGLAGYRRRARSVVD